uniref:Uncharacterized protein n=1 Tax=Setaria italica TaxID=4555 RepID=K4ANP2_SETIT
MGRATQQVQCHEEGGWDRTIISPRFSGAK